MTSNVTQDGVLHVLLLLAEVYRDRPLQRCQKKVSEKQVSLCSVLFPENEELFTVIRADAQRGFFFPTAKSQQAQVRNPAMPLQEQIASGLPLLVSLQHKRFPCFLMYSGQHKRFATRNYIT